MNRSTGGSLTPPTALTEVEPARFASSAAEVADEVADLLLAEQQPLDVLRLALEERLVDVDDREARVREPLRGRGHRVALREPDADDQVEPLSCERRHVRDVVGGDFDSTTRPVIPSSRSARLSPLKASSLKPLSFSWPASATSATLSDALGVVVVVVAGGLVVTAAACREHRPGGDRRREREELRGHSGHGVSWIR